MEKRGSSSKLTVLQRIKNWWCKKPAKNTKKKIEKSPVTNAEIIKPNSYRKVNIKELNKKIKKITAMAIASSRKRAKELKNKRERERERE